MRRPLIIGNWKLDGSRSQLLDFFKGFEETQIEQSEMLDMAMCLPYPFFYEAKQSIASSALLLGAQNVSDKFEGSVTGEVSAKLLREYQVDLAMVGASDRRLNYFETNENIALRCQQALSEEITPVFFVGENSKQRQDSASYQVIGDQLMPLFDLIPENQLDKIIISYEPLWAEEANKAPDADSIQEVHEFIRAVFSDVDQNIADKLRILLCDKSLTAEAASNFIKKADIDGFVVTGQTATTFDGFAAICRAALN